MKEFDTTDPPDPNPECLDSYSRKRIADLSEITTMLLERIRELEAKVEDLHATDSQRRLNMASKDPEWY